MKKAFDHVSWGFVDHMLENLGFGTRWRSWIKECITTTCFAVMINGGPSKFFNVTTGLRQGDPSPHFYLLLSWKHLTNL